MIRPCEHCGKDYDAKTKRSRFCSDACRFNAWATNKRNSSVATENNANRDDLILAELRALRAENAALQERLTVIDSRTERTERKIDNMQVTTVTTVRTTTERRPSNDDLIDLLEVHAAAPDKSGRAAENLINSMLALEKSTQGGPKQIDVPSFDTPSFDDLIDSL